MTSQITGRRGLIALVAVCAMAASLPAPASDWGFGRVQGSGVEKTETRNVGDFTRVEVSGATVLEISAGQSATSVSVTADDNILPLIETKVVAGVLRIGSERSHSRKLPVTVKIGMPKLEGIQASGSSKINATNVNSASFELHGSGSTKAVVAGTAGTVKLHLSGASNVDASKLTAKDGNIHASGASDVEINASDSLTVHISGAGKVLYSGHPTITQEISGAGRIAAR